MKFFHTADWHLGKLVQGVSMTEDQRYILNQFIKDIEEEQPDAVIIAGDLYDRAVPSSEAVDLLDEVLERIVLKLKTPVVAVAGNHDSPSRLDFASNLLKKNGCFIYGQLKLPLEPVILHDVFGEVHFHPVPYTDPAVVRSLFQDDEIRTHQDAMEKIIEHIEENMKKDVRHVFIGHAFVTPYGEEGENTSESERPLAIGGAEYVSARLFEKFHYTALGHLHQSHDVLNENIRYAGSPLKYSISEEHHKKGYYIVEMDGDGRTKVEKRQLIPARDLRTVSGKMDDILRHERNEDYVFVRLLDETPVLSPMEKIRTVYPNAMAVTREISPAERQQMFITGGRSRTEMDDLSLFRAFYREIKNEEVPEEMEAIFKEVLEDVLKEGEEQIRERASIKK